MASGESVIGVIADLRAEQEELDSIVAAMGGADWRLSTPAEGWDVRDQIGHLTFFDRRATMAIDNADSFASEIAAAGSDMDRYMESHLDASRSSTSDDVLTDWRSARGRLLTVLETLEPTTRIRWYGPDMSARSFATARLMETWAHGQDIRDALGVRLRPTGRLRQIAFLGVRTMAWSFAVNGFAPPDETVRVDLIGPDGDHWIWNEDSEENQILGHAEDFCLVTTQRRHLGDTDLDVIGPIARQWMDIAQAFAGPPGAGRSPGQFRGDSFRVR